MLIKSIRINYGITILGLGLVLLPFLFQNCSGVKLVPADKSSLIQSNQINGIICHSLGSELVSPYTLSDFYVLNLTVVKNKGLLEADSDMDGIPDSISDPVNNPVMVAALDTDGDKIPDFIEKLKGLNPLIADSDIDGIDNDGILNRRELQLGTDPQFSGDDPVTDYTLRVTNDTSGCGQGQKAYGFSISKLITLPTAKFEDKINPSLFSLSHGENENVIFILARMSPTNTSNPEIFLYKKFKINYNEPLNSSLKSTDFSIFGNSSENCSNCGTSGLGNFYTQIYSSKKFSCALATNKNAYCWGDNAYGQIGDGTLIPKLKPTKILLNEAIDKMSLGGGHSCALTTAGDVYCWGKNNFGQLGINSVVDSDHPQKVPLSARATLISAGQSHSCAVLITNEVWCWGLNANYQLGTGTTSNSLVPIKNSITSANVSFPILELSSGGNNNCLIDNFGVVSCWGTVSTCVQTTVQHVPARCQSGTQFPFFMNSYGIWKKIVTNGTETAGIRTRAPDTALLYWNSSILNNDGANLIPVNSSGAGATLEYYNGISNLVKITLGLKHSCAINKTTVNSKLVNILNCWGENSKGQIAMDPSELPINYSPSPNPVVSEPIDVSSGDEFSCAIDKNGVIYCWGLNNFGQLGTGDIMDSFNPVRVLGQ